MAHPILMPKPGQMTEECVLTAWHRREGDEVHRGDVLFEIETDKSNMDVEAFDDGVLLARLVEEGQAVPVNAVVAFVGLAGETIPVDVMAAAIATLVPASAAAPASPPVSQTAAASAAPAAAVATSQPVASSGAGGRRSGRGERTRISPRASRLAAEAGLDPRAIAGTGPDGRIVERDVQAAMAARDATAATDAGAAMRAVPAAMPAPAPAVRPVPSPVVLPVDGEEEPRPLSRMRRVIAERLTFSATTIPHFTVTVAVDVTRLLALRKQLKDAGTALTVTDFVLAATAQTLVEFPDVNSRTDGVSVWPRRRVHLGVAVSVPAGLVVPVIRDADRLGVTALHDRAASLASAARDGSLPPDEMAGSTFTVSNLGMLGVDEFSAIINPGEAAILAVSAAVPTPAVLGDGIAIRSIMKLTLSADHRLVDGEMGARFLNAIRRRLEDTAAFSRELMNS